MPPLKSANLDQIKLASLVEPLHVRVERMRGSLSSPISVPPRNEGITPGSGWNKDDVAGIEDWLHLEWTGGGQYRITVTDTNGQQVQWTPFWDVRTYPEKPPPTDMFLMGPPAPSPTGPVVMPVTQFQSRPTTPIHSNPNGAYQMSDIVSRKDEEIRRLEKERMEIEYRGRGEAERQRHARELDELRRQAEAGKSSVEASEVLRLREERDRMERERLESRLADQVRAIADMVKSQQQPVGPDPRILALEQQIETQRREAREERDRYERRAEQALIQQQMKETEQRTAAMFAEMKASAAAAANKGPDPTLMAMTEMQRQNAENMRELARMQTQQMAQVQSLMMPPTAIIQMLKDSSNGSDMMLKSVIGNFSGIFDTYKSAMEQVAQLNQGGNDSPTVRIIETGIQKVDGLVERYFESQAVKAQAQAQVEIAKVRATSPPVAVSGNNAPPQKRIKAAQTPSGGLNGAAQPVPNAPKAALTPDQAWFGPALKSINDLRAGVMEHLNNLQAKEPKLDAKGELLGVSAEQAVKYVLQGIAVVQQQGLNVKAFELVNEMRFPEFFDLLLPAPVPQTFRDHCIQIMNDATKIPESQVTVMPDEDDVEGDEDEDGEDAE